MLSWEHERILKRMVITLVFSAICIVLAKVGIQNLPPFIKPDEFEQLLAKLGGLLIEVIAVLKLDVANAAVMGEVTALAGVGLMALTTGWSWLSPALHDRAFAAFDRSRLNRVTSLSDDGGLPWTVGRRGPRRQAWDALTRWARKIGSNQTRFGRYTVAYKLAVISGRSGSGKTRMSEELGLLLARLGDYAPTNRLQRISLDIMAWVRRTAPGLHAKPYDPWDVARINQKGSGRNWSEYLEDLRAWRPRRPTLILLDDPTSKDVIDVHNALSRGGEQHAFQYPVILLVANQTIPENIPFKFDDINKKWMFDGAFAEPEPVTLSAASWFDEMTVGDLVKASGCLKGLPHGMRVEANQGAIFRITAGNPLLVSLSIDWLRTKKSLTGMTVETLTSERAKRILNSLRQAGIESSHYYLELMVSCLSGGAEATQLNKATTDTGMQGGISFSSLPFDKIKACFPSDELRTSGGALIIPSIKPDLIVAPFFEAVLDCYAIDDDTLQKVIAAACALDIDAVLRIYRNTAVASKLHKAISLAPVADKKTPRVNDIAQALFERVALCDTQTPLRDSSDDIELMQCRLFQICNTRMENNATDNLLDVDNLLNKNRIGFPRDIIRVNIVAHFIFNSYTYASFKVNNHSFEMLTYSLILHQPFGTGSLIPSSSFGRSYNVGGYWQEGDGESVQNIGALLDIEKISVYRYCDLLNTNENLVLSSLLNIEYFFKEEMLTFDLIDSLYSENIGLNVLTTNLISNLSNGEFSADEFNRFTTIINGEEFDIDKFGRIALAMIALRNKKEFKKDNEQDITIFSWLEWVSSQLDGLATSEEAIKNPRRMVLYMLSEALLYDNIRYSNGFTSGPDSRSETNERRWNSFKRNAEFARYILQADQNIIVAFVAACSSLVSGSGKGRPYIVDSFERLIERCPRVSPEIGEMLIALISFAEIYNECTHDHSACLRKFDASIFSKDTMVVFDGFTSLKLEALRLSHIAACEIGGPDNFYSKKIESGMRKILENFEFEISPFALVFARLS